MQNLDQNYTNKLFKDAYHNLALNVDRHLKKILIMQWFFSIAIAFFFTPKTWIGTTSIVHIHIYASVFLGAIITLLPLYFLHSRPGMYLNRYLSAINLMSFSILLIHLTGGRIETHFHIFVSLAVLSFYRDIKVLIFAATLSILDHLIRGFFWPLSVYGIDLNSLTRGFEHAFWVVLECTALSILIRSSLAHLRSLSYNQSVLEHTLNSVEELANKKTVELHNSQAQIIDQQQQLINSSKMSAIGELAGTVAHEINTPLAVILLKSEQSIELMKNKRDSFNDEDIINSFDKIKNTTDRISKIIKSLMFVSRNSNLTSNAEVKISEIIDEAKNLCSENFKSNGILFNVKYLNNTENISINCNPVEISQVFLNLLKNSTDAILKQSEKWIRIECMIENYSLKINFIDSGHGIDKSIMANIMKPFFTTKEIGKGTGLGLSISKKIIESHGGQFNLDPNSFNTKFVITLPLK